MPVVTRNQIRRSIQVEEEQQPLNRPVPVQHQQEMAEEQDERAEAIPTVRPIKFGGRPTENVERFIRQFNRAARANQWSDETKLIQFPCYLEGTALEVYEETEEDDATYEEACDRLKRAFEVEPSDDKAFFELTTRKQGPREDTNEFVSEIVRLCIKVNATMEEREKVHYVLRGLTNKSVLSKITLMENPTISRLRTNLQKIEVAERFAGSGDDRGASSSTPTTYERDEIQRLRRRVQELEVQGRNRNSNGSRNYWNNANANKRDTRVEAPGRTQDGQVICFNCRQKGHYSKNCRQRRV